MDLIVQWCRDAFRDLQKNRELGIPSSPSLLARRSAYCSPPQPGPGPSTPGSTPGGSPGTPVGATASPAPRKGANKRFSPGSPKPRDTTAPSTPQSSLVSPQSPNTAAPRGPTSPPQGTSPPTTGLGRGVSQQGTTKHCDLCFQYQPHARSSTGSLLYQTHTTAMCRSWTQPRPVGPSMGVHTLQHAGGPPGIPGAYSPPVFPVNPMGPSWNGPGFPAFPMGHPWSGVPPPPPYSPPPSMFQGPGISPSDSWGLGGGQSGGPPGASPSPATNPSSATPSGN